MNRREVLMAGGGLSLAGVLGVGWSSIGRAEQGFAHEALSVAEMRERGALIVDIRTPPEWAQTGVVEGAELVTFESARSFPAAFLTALGDQIEDGREVALICRSGNRTQAAGQALAGVIDNQVISVSGGIKRLIREGLKTVPVP